MVFLTLIGAWAKALPEWLALGLLLPVVVAGWRLGRVRDPVLVLSLASLVLCVQNLALIRWGPHFGVQNTCGIDLVALSGSGVALIVAAWMVAAQADRRGGILDFRWALCIEVAVALGVGTWSLLSLPSPFWYAPLACVLVWLGMVWSIPAVGPKGRADDVLVIAALGALAALCFQQISVDAATVFLLGGSERLSWLPKVTSDQQASKVQVVVLAVALMGCGVGTAFLHARAGKPTSWRAIAAILVSLALVPALRSRIDLSGTSLSQVVLLGRGSSRADPAQVVAAVKVQVDPRALLDLTPLPGSEGESWWFGPGGLLPDDTAKIDGAPYVGEALLRGSTVDGRLEADAIQHARSCLDLLRQQQPEVAPVVLDRSPRVDLWLTATATAQLRSQYDLDERAKLAARGRLGLADVDGVLEGIGATRIRQFSHPDGSAFRALLVELPWTTDSVGAAWRLTRLPNVEYAAGDVGEGTDGSHVEARMDASGVHLISYTGLAHRTYETFSCELDGTRLRAEGRHDLPDAASLLSELRADDPWRALHAIQALGLPPHLATRPPGPEVAEVLRQAMTSGDARLERASWSALTSWRGALVDRDDPTWETWAATPPLPPPGPCSLPGRLERGSAPPPSCLPPFLLPPSSAAIPVSRAALAPAIPVRGAPPGYANLVVPKQVRAALSVSPGGVTVRLRGYSGSNSCNAGAPELLVESSRRGNTTTIDVVGYGKNPDRGGLCLDMVPEVTAAVQVDLPASGVENVVVRLGGERNELGIERRPYEIHVTPYSLINVSLLEGLWEAEGDLRIVDAGPTAVRLYLAGDVPEDETALLRTVAATHGWPVVGSLGAGWGVVVDLGPDDSADVVPGPRASAVETNVPGTTAWLYQVEGGATWGKGEDAGVEVVARKNAGQVKYCYETRLKARGDLHGTVEVNWRIAGGRVTSAEVVANTTGDAELGDCVLGMVKRWTGFSSTAEVEGRWPFVFKLPD